MAIPDVLNHQQEKLVASSPAYKAYIARESLPEHAGIWKLNEEGRPVIRSGEVFCRMESEFGEACGAKFTGKSTNPHLREHIQQEHGVPSTPRKPKPNVAFKNEETWLNNFYSQLMQHEEYESKPNPKKRKAPAMDMGDSEEDVLEFEVEIGVLKEKLVQAEFKEIQIQKQLHQAEIDVVEARKKLAEKKQKL